MDLVSPITDVVTRIVDYSTRHLNYLCALNKNLNQLEEEMTQLDERKKDLKNKVIAEQERQKEPTHEVQGWIKRVENKEPMVHTILLQGKQLLQKRCLSGSCPKNCWSSYKLGKKVVENLELVKELNSKGVFETVAEKPPTHCTPGEELPEDFTVGLDFEFESCVNLLEKDDVGVLGLYGIGGVGKTTLLKKINNEFGKRNNYFNIVIWVVISSEVNIRTIQEAIGKRLGLSWPESDSLSSRASDLCNALRKKKFLILLDDVWGEINLQSIGIPRPNVQNMSKIVLTTRSLEVCGSMGARRTIEVNCLNKHQSWNLFEEKVGPETLAADPQIPKLAKKVAEKCHGLPLALITIGASMASRRDPREWKAAITDLSKSPAKFQGMEEQFHLLKFSYDRLPNRVDQLCFLFCALYPEDGLIIKEDLIEKWIGAGYIGGFENYEEALNEGSKIIGNLVRTCLLENWGADIGVKMHDVIRELALWIARECGKRDGKVLIKSGKALTELPLIHLHQAVVQKISLIDTNISHLENLPHCPNLSIFFAPKNMCLNHIVDTFFLSMPALKFLDLSESGITKVPTSICELFELEFLDLSGTKITSLPYEMKNLTKLKYLSFAETELLRIIPGGMMMNLLNLEILELQVPKSDDSDEEVHINIDELRYLKQLKSLDISISDFNDLEKFVSNPRLCICTRALRVKWCNEITSCLSSGHFKQLRILQIKDCPELKEWFLDCIANNDEAEDGLFENLEWLLLENLPELVISWGVRNLHHAHFIKLHFVCLDGCHAMVDFTFLLLIPHLQSLSIYNCGGLQEILSSSSDKSGGVHYQNTFSKLKFLTLCKLPKLLSICSITLAFASLETITVLDCPKLRRLPLDSNSGCKLTKIEGDEEWLDRLERENEIIKTKFQSHLYYFDQ